MQVSDQIIQVLDAVCKKLGVVVDWTLDWTQSTIIPYVQQLMGKIVAYELWTSLVWVLFGVIGWVFFVYTLKHAKHAFREDSDCDEEIAIGLFVVGCIVAVVCSVIIVQQTFDIVTCLTFPEKVIYEFVRPYIPN